MSVCMYVCMHACMYVQICMHMERYLLCRLDRFAFGIEFPVKIAHMWPMPTRFTAQVLSHYHKHQRVHLPYTSRCKAN